MSGNEVEEEEESEQEICQDKSFLKYNVMFWIIMSKQVESKEIIRMMRKLIK